MKTCSKCKVTKPKQEFYKAKRHSLGLSSWCKSCVLVYNRVNKKRKNLRLKIWRDKNREHVRKQDGVYRKALSYKAKKRLTGKLWQKRTRKINPTFRIAQNMRSRVRLGLFSSNGKKASKTTKLLGCSFSFLKKYLESKFKKGMSWSNYGEWHIDHIIPLSKFDLTKKTAQYKAFNYKNLQPLWAIDNMKKGNRYVGKI
jgi:hypothetical protein